MAILPWKTCPRGKFQGQVVSLEKFSKLVVQPKQKWPMPGDVEMALLFFQKFQQII
jgi:hypothetical protein